VATRHSTHQVPIVPPARVRYLADIADTVRGYKRRAREQAALAREVQQLREAQRMLHEASPTPARLHRWTSWPRSAKPGWTRDAGKLLAHVARHAAAYAGDEYVVKIRDKEIRTALTHTTLSGNKIRKVALPPTRTTASC
jgi:methylmalonyl-CoA mutase